MGDAELDDKELVNLDARAGYISIAKRTVHKSPRQRRRSFLNNPKQATQCSQISAQYHNRMLVEAAERGDAEEAVRRMDKLCADGLRPECTAFNTFVVALALHGEVEVAEEWLVKAGTPALYPNLVGSEATALTLNTVVTTFAKKGHLPKAEKYACEMQDKGMLFSEQTYVTLLKACLAAGESRRAHRWCLEMAESGYRKPNKAMMKDLICALADAGNTQSANHWLTFMADNSQHMDKKTYEHVRRAYPVDIVPAGLSGEVGKSVPPALRPATVGEHRGPLVDLCRYSLRPRTVPPLGQAPEQSPTGSPRRQRKLHSKKSIAMVEDHQLRNMRSWAVDAAEEVAAPRPRAVMQWLEGAGTGEAWLNKRGLSLVPGKTVQMA